MSPVVSSFVVSCAVCVAGCGAPGAHDAGADASIDSTAPERPVPLERPPTCGGTVEGAGSGLDGPFVARYIYVRRCDGDCPPLTITVAAGPLWADASFDFFLWSGGAETFTGPWTVQVLARSGADPNGTGTSGALDITVADPPGLTTKLGAPPFGQVTGTFTIKQGVIDLSGTFSSPVCASDLRV